LTRHTASASKGGRPEHARYLKSFAGPIYAARRPQFSANVVCRPIHEGEAMRRVQVWVWLYLALGYALAPPSAVAQAAGGAAEQGKAGEFSRLYERWQQAQDPEERIKLGEHAFALEAAVTAWELAVPRERVRGELWFGIGN